jgi:hypothetical protein
MALSPLQRLRAFAAWNFVASIAVAIVWFGWEGVAALMQADPTRLRINRVPLGAAFLVVIQIVLLLLYRRRGEITGLVRVFAALLGTVQFLQSVVVAWIAYTVYEQPFPTALQEVSWYLCASNLLFALAGPPVDRKVD